MRLGWALLLSPPISHQGLRCFAHARDRREEVVTDGVATTRGTVRSARTRSQRRSGQGQEHHIHFALRRGTVGRVTSALDAALDELALNEAGLAR